MPASSWNSRLQCAQAGPDCGPLQDRRTPIRRSGITLDIAHAACCPRVIPHRAIRNTEIKILALNSLFATVILPRAVPLPPDDPHRRSDTRRKNIHALFHPCPKAARQRPRATMRDLLLGKMGSGPAEQRDPVGGASMKGRRPQTTHSSRVLQVDRRHQGQSVSVISAFFRPRTTMFRPGSTSPRSEKNLELKRTIVSQLSLMRGQGRLGLHAGAAQVASTQQTNDERNLAPGAPLWPIRIFQIAPIVRITSASLAVLLLAARPCRQRHNKLDVQPQVRQRPSFSTKAGWRLAAQDHQAHSDKLRASHFGSATGS